MKKIILLLFISVIIISCSTNNKEKIDGETIITIDSCEYIVCHPNSTMYLHKGNCKYCNERRKQEIKELIIELKNN